MVLENVRTSLKGDVSRGTPRLGFLFISCRFGLGFRDWDHSPSVHFLGDGVGGCCCKRPTYKLPIVGSTYIFDIEPENGCWFD
jgi:hypothetical protein